MHSTVRLIAIGIAAALSFRSGICQQAQSLSTYSPQASQPSSGQEPEQAPPPQTESPREPRCAEIAAMGSSFDPLAQACQYALSPQSLPNFVCEETIQRATNGHRFDTVTTEVTVLHGRDRYSKYTLNGTEVHSIEGTGGWVSNALFASQLNAIFRPDTKAAFAFQREAKSHSGPHSGPVEIFAYRFERSGTSSFSISGAYPAMAGSIAIDRKTGQLQRVETLSTKVDPAHSLVSYKSSVIYSDVPIPDLGKLLLPVSAEEKVCLRNGNCFKNQLSFHDCRKFGSKSRILPATEP